MRRSLALATLVAALLLTLAGAAAAQAAEPSPRVKNGTSAASGNYGWTVALVTAGRSGYAGQFCGGTLVQPDVVLTAAHCLVGTDPDDVDVLAGVETLSEAGDEDPGTAEPQRSDPSNAGLYHDVASISLHPDAVISQSETRNDLAMVRLVTPVTDAPTIPVITVDAFGALVPGTTRLKVTGWGRMTGDVYADTLQEGDLDLVSDEDCARTWGRDFDATSMVCAIDAGPPVVDSCDGDSGGPLTTIGSDPIRGTGYELVGVVSFGTETCDVGGAPGVYTRLGAPGLNAYAVNAATPPQPRHLGGRPALAGNPVEGGALSCGGGDAAFDDGDLWADRPLSVSLSILRLPDLAPVGVTSYALTARDVGFQFVCRATATAAGAGGFAVSDSAVTPAVTAAPPAPAPPPAPVPPPVVVTPPVTEPEDTAAPRVRSVRRRCSRKRRCTFVVRTTDAAPSAGVRTVQATLTGVSRRRCKRRGRRATCARVVTRTLRARKRDDGRFRIRTGRLRKGRYTLALVSIDGAGNLQTRPYRLGFRLRSRAAR